MRPANVLIADVGNGSENSLAGGPRWRDAAPGCRTAYRAPCLARPCQVTMRAFVNVLAQDKPETQLPVVDG
jgi:hypothetical protein